MCERSAKIFRLSEKKMMEEATDSDSGSKPLKNLNGQVCQKCGDTVGLTATGDVFVACNECALPFCLPCYEFERKNGNQSCPQCNTRFLRHNEGPGVQGDDAQDDVDDLENEFNYGQGNTKAWEQWEEDANLSSSSVQDSQQPIRCLPNGQLMSGQIACATPDTQSLRTTSGQRQPGLESDEEIRRVPEIGSEYARMSASHPDTGSIANSVQVQGTGEGQRKRGRSSADKESKRLKRLLRNRVSAQQARERKKAYLFDLEVRVKDLVKQNSELNERLSTLQNENQMLRHILKNTTASKRGSTSGTNAEGTL